MSSQKEQIQCALKVLIGLPLSIARRAADMRNFHFGSIRIIEKGSAGDYALHIQCPWRIEGPNGIVTGGDDLWEPANEQDYDENWDYDKTENLQDSKLKDLLKGYNVRTRSYINKTDKLVVEAIEATENADLMIVLTGGYKIRIFPCGGRAEDWRFFKPESDERHFVISGGKIEWQH
jgi:hypothetical protein